MDRRLTWYILAGMVLGVIVGQVLHAYVDPAVVKESVAPWLKLLSDIFLNLIKLLVAPLVLSTIVVGIANMGDSSALGRIGFRAISWFIIASLISIGLGLIMVNLFQPGVGAPIPERPASSCRSSPRTRLKRWPPTTSCRSWFSRSSRALPWPPSVKRARRWCAGPMRWRK